MTGDKLMAMKNDDGYLQYRLAMIKYLETPSGTGARENTPVYTPPDRGCLNDAIKSLIRDAQQTPNPKKNKLYCARVNRKSASIAATQIPARLRYFPQSNAKLGDFVVLIEVVNPEAALEDLIIVVSTREGPGGLMFATSWLYVGEEEVCACVKAEGSRPSSCTCEYLDLAKSLAWYESQKNTAAS